jgi:hypothetical protein
MNSTIHSQSKISRMRLPITSNRFCKLLGIFLFVEKHHNKAAFPHPTTERIIPFVVSQWNAIKGGSDTITELLWLNMYDPPCNSPQSHTIARMFLLTNVTVYHLHHFFTSKPNLDEGYPSLKHFRWAASKKSSFHETLLQIAKAIKNRTILPAASVSPSMSDLGIEEILTRRNDTHMKVVVCRTLSMGVTPQRFIKR